MKLLNISIGIICAIVSASVFSLTPADSRESFRQNQINLMDDGDLCPKESNKKYHHHFVLVDTTTPLTPSQADLLRRLVLPEPYLAGLAPWDRVTIMEMSVIKPAKNRPLFSKCRPRSGDPASRYKIDKHDWKYETKANVSRIYRDRFLKGIYSTVDRIENPDVVGTNVSEDALVNSPIMGQIKEISRILDMGFTKTSGYESRKLTIVSDLAQNTTRLPFYKLCPPVTRTCPTWKGFKTNKKYARAIERQMPDFSADVEVEIIYLNNRFDPYLDKGIIDFWENFFLDAGVKNFDYQVETDQ